MRYGFNIHIERVHRVEIESDKGPEEAKRAVYEAFLADKPELGEGEDLRAEFWDDAGDEFAESTQWGGGFFG